MSPLLKNLLIILVLGSIVLLGVFIYLNQEKLEDLPGGKLLTKNKVASSDALLEAKNFQERYDVFEKSVKLDDSLFTDERFRSLVDFRQPIIETAIGRANPYVPVE